MTDMTYEGWANRETWATNLWLANDEGLYHLTLDTAAECLELLGDADAVYALADALHDQFAEWANDIIDGEAVPGLRSMILDIGSLYRVEWRDIAEHWIDDVRAEADAS